jgi:8-oxo-dGTP diphosphatase
VKADRYVVNVEAAIYRDDGRWLIMERSEDLPNAAGLIAWVGGKVEGGAMPDALEQTARREVREEVGLELGPELHYVQSSLFVADDGTAVVDVVFLARYVGGEPRPQAGEVEAVHWLTAEEMLARPDVPAWHAASLRQALELRRRLGW